MRKVTWLSARYDEGKLNTPQRKRYEAMVDELMAPSPGGQENMPAV